MTATFGADPLRTNVSETVRAASRVGVVVESLERGCAEVAGGLDGAGLIDCVPVV